MPLPEGWSQIGGQSDFSAIEAEPELPAKVTDGTGTEVEVKDIDKIIVAGDGVASTLGALGLADKSTAAPTDAVSPEAKDAPELFEFSKSTGVDGLLAMDGTLFIGDSIKRHGDVAGQFRDAGTDAVVMDDQQSQGDKLKAVPSYVGAEEAGEELAKTVDDQLADAAKTAEDSGTTDLSIIEVTASGAGNQNTVAGTGTSGNEMIETLGYTSVGAESKLRGYSREFCNEGIVASAPDVIVMAESGYEKWGGEDGLAVTGLISVLARPGRNTGTSRMLLVGIAVGSGCQALTGFFTFIADDAALQTLTFWQMGSLGKAIWPQFFATCPIVIIGVFIATALLTGAAVAFAGAIGFVGLVVPHIVRIIVGPGHRGLLPISAPAEATPPAEAVVRADDVTFAVDGRELVSGISFDLGAGGVVALVGPNGAGKSTMLSLLSGNVTPTRGSVEIAGTEVGAWKSGPLARQRAVMLQHNSSTFAFSVREAVHMGRLPWDVEDQRDARLVAEAIDDSDLGGFEARDITTLSGGGAARVSYARTRVPTTPIILLDEPTAALDLRHQETLLRSVRELRDEGAAVIVVLHDLNLALRCADRVLVLGNGRLVADGSPRQALSEELVAVVYGQRVRRLEAAGIDTPILVPV